MDAMGGGLTVKDFIDDEAKCGGPGGCERTPLVNLNPGPIVKAANGEIKGENQ